MLADHLAEHRHETVDGVGRTAGGGREALDRVVRPVDVRHRVDEIERGAGRGHRSRILCGPRRGRFGSRKGPFGAPFVSRGVRREAANRRRVPATKRKPIRRVACEAGGAQKQKRATRCRCRAIQCSYSSKRARHCQENSLEQRSRAKLLPVRRMKSAELSETLANERENLRTQSLGLLLEDRGLPLHLGHERGVLDHGQVDPDVQEGGLDARVQKQGGRARRRRPRWGCPSRRAPAGRRAGARPPGRCASGPPRRGGWRGRSGASRAPSVRPVSFGERLAATTSS